MDIFDALELVGAIILKDTCSMFDQTFRGECLSDEEKSDLRTRLVLAIEKFAMSIHAECTSESLESKCRIETMERISNQVASAIGSNSPIYTKALDGEGLGRPVLVVSEDLSISRQVAQRLKDIWGGGEEGES